jgi:hypothetical protein
MLETRGHQDKHTSYNLLDMWGELNVEIDSMAKTYWNVTNSLVLPFYPELTFGWGLWIGDQKLSSWNHQELYTNHTQSTDILDPWSQR